jgi:hypothetical protein
MLNLWPKVNNKEDTNVIDPANADQDKTKVVEKTPAELIAEALSPFKTQLDTISTKFDNLEKNAVTRPTPEARAEERHEPTSVLDDENAAFAQRLTPVLVRQFEMESRMVRGEIRAEYQKDGYGELWDKYEADINKVLEGSPLVTAEGKPLRGDPDYIRNVVDMVFGREARKAGMRFDGKSKGFFLESGSNGSDNGNHGPVDDGLSEGQRKVFGRMKVSPEDAKKVMGKLKFVNA